MTMQTELRHDLPNGTALRGAEARRHEAYAFFSAARMRAAFPMPEAAWRSFAQLWDNLTLDRHMGDGGLYRFRRYGAFEMSTPEAALRLLPHAAYAQPSYINALNGDMERWFDPLEPAFVNHLFLHRLLHTLGHMFDDARGRTGPWNIRLHPYRIRARAGVAGQPTPEGLHRDGVDYIVTMMVARHNVRGGTTIVADSNGNTLFEHRLEQPMEMLVADDAMCMHAVTAVDCIDPNAESYRDVLVVAFTAIDL